jgi:hypothetical protein
VRGHECGAAAVARAKRGRAADAQRGQVKPDEYSSPTAVRLAAVIAPGIIMTPLSSILEATNAVRTPSQPPRAPTL